MKLQYVRPAMTTEQKERMIGRVMMGATDEDAVHSLGIDVEAYFATVEVDKLFSVVLDTARYSRDGFEDAMLKAIDESDTEGAFYDHS